MIIRNAITGNDAARSAVQRWAVKEHSKLNAPVVRTAYLIVGATKAIVKIVKTEFANSIDILPLGVTGFLCLPHVFDGKFTLLDGDEDTAHVEYSAPEWSGEIKLKDTNYGNIDWIGALEGVDTSEQRVLTWRGPIHRHPVKKPDFTKEIPGLTHHEQTIIVDGLPTASYTMFSPYIYQEGELYATAPPVNRDLGGEFKDLALVLGAAIHDEITVCMVALNLESGFWYQCYIRTGDSDLVYSEDNPGGWRLLGQVESPTRPYTCFFFNADGTEATCVQNGVRYTVAINYEELSCQFFVSSGSVTTRTKTFSESDINGTNTPGGSINPPSEIFTPPYTAVLNQWANTQYEHNIDVKAGFTDIGEKLIGVDYAGMVPKEIRVTYNGKYDTRRQFHPKIEFDVVSGLEIKGNRDIYVGTPSLGPYTANLALLNKCENPTWSTTMGTITPNETTGFGTLIITDTERCDDVSGNWSVTLSATDPNDSVTTNKIISVPKMVGTWCAIESDPSPNYFTPSDKCGRTDYTDDPANCIFDQIFYIDDTFRYSVSTLYAFWDWQLEEPYPMSYWVLTLGLQEIPAELHTAITAQGYNPAYNWFPGGWTKQQLKCPNCSA